LGAPPRIITDNDTLRAQYHTLTSGDIVTGRVRLKPGEEPLLLDLLDRGVLLIPSALSQLASRLKSFQTKLFTSFLPPLTLAIHDLHELTDAISVYGRKATEKVVTKHDRRNAGMGVHLWSSIEEVYTQASFGVIPLPFVLQPFYPDCRDIRVVILDGYEEAYQRHNPHNFRNNLHCGGKSAPCELSRAQRDLCRQVMERGKFPYAHIDLMVMADNSTFLGEINLRGGIKGASITPAEYGTRVAAIHQKCQQEALAG